VVVAGAVVAGVMVTGATASDASPTLPSRTPAQLIAAVLNSNATTLIGKFQETANFGIPSLPGDHGSASLSWQTFISGTHSARVWADGADKQRVALIGELSEADVVHNGSDVWSYTSDTNTVTHSTIPKGTHADQTPSAADATPAAIAARALKAVGPSTKVSVDNSSMVAGRAAYTLVLQPRDTRSTVREVTIAIDATKLIPLQVSVYGSGSTPAFRTGFTSISFAKPSASTFVFHTPAGATTSNDPFGINNTHGDHHGSRHQKVTGKPEATDPSAGASSKAKVLGTGWTSVVELPAGKGGAASVLNGNMLQDLTSPIGSSGDRLLHTALVNAVILADGRTFVGAVQPALLEHIAATTPH
jgi:outer membrane lipoprotein-sorting protein